MVLADLGRKINSALRSLSNAVVINEEVSVVVKRVIYVMCTYIYHCQNALSAHKPLIVYCSRDSLGIVKITPQDYFVGHYA